MLGWQARESSSILSLDAGGARQHAGDEARGRTMLKAAAGGQRGGRDGRHEAPRVHGV